MAGPSGMWRLPLVTRAEWGAVPARARTPLSHPIKTVVLSFHTGLKPCDCQEECIRRVKRLQERHMEMGLNDIHYNFVIGGDGLIYEGRGWHFQSSKSQESPGTHGQRLDIGFLQDDESPRCRYRPPHIHVPPALRALQYGYNKKYLKMTYAVEEDLKQVKHEPCSTDNVDNL